MKNPDNCSGVGELIPQFLAGRLDADDERRVREHLEGCVDCRQRANAVSLLQQTPVPIPDPDRWNHFVNGVVGATGPEPRKNVRRRAVTVITAVAAAAIIAVSWVRIVQVGSEESVSIEVIAREVAELPDAEAQAWTAGLSPTAFMPAGFDTAGLSEAELQQLATEVGRT